MKAKLILLAVTLTCSMSFAQTSKVQQTVNDLKETIHKETTEFNETSKSGVKTVYSDTKDGISTVYNDVKSLTPELRDAVKSIAQGLKTTSEEVWHILVRQQKVWSWCYLIGGIFAAIAWFHFYYRFKKYSKEAFKDNEHLPWQWSQILICSFLFITATILSAIFAHNLVDMMTGFINPEFGAMKNIVQIASKLNQ